MSNKSSSEQSSNFPPLPPFVYRGNTRPPGPRPPGPRPGAIPVPVQNQFTVLGQIPQIPSISSPLASVPPLMNATFSQKVSSSISSTSATPISPPLPDVNPLIPKSYIRLVCFVESPYDNECDPYKVAAKILPPE
jgi:hypothetical protein